MEKSNNRKEVWGLSAAFLVMVILSLLIGAVSAKAEEIIVDTEKGVPGFWTEPARDLPGNWWYVHDHTDT